MPRPKELFLVFQDGPDEQFYNQYETLEAAVKSESIDAVIFKANLECLGTYKIVTKLEKKGKRK